MEKYYFKIKKGDLEFEFSTSDKTAFEEQLSDWIRGVMKSESPIVDSPVIENENKSERKGFIEVKEFVKINELQTPQIPDSSETIIHEENFAEILEDSLQNPKVEVIEKTEIITPFAAYLSAFKPESQTDYMILAAKFLADNENIHNFSLKQLNAKLVPATGKPIDHNVINDAIERQLINVIPNYTDVADVTEYSLAPWGESYVVHQ